MTNYDANLLSRFQGKPPNASLAQRKADAPLKPKVAQQPRHELGGLFGDEHLQIDLMDLIRSTKS